MSEQSRRPGRLRRAGERGATSVEYGVLVAVFAVALIGGVVLLQQGVKTVFVAQAAQISDPGTGSPTPLPTSSSALPTSSSALPTSSSALPTSSSALPTSSSALPTSSSALPTSSLAPITLPNYSIAKGATIKLNLLPGLPSGATVTAATRVGDGTMGVTSGDYTYTAANGSNKSAEITFTYSLGGTTVAGNKVTIST